MYPFVLILFFNLISFATSIPTSSFIQTLHRRNYRNYLPDGYSIERQPGTAQVDQTQVYGAIILAMISLANKDSRNLTDPGSYTYPGIILNITGADEDTQYHPLFASYTLYHALEVMITETNLTASNFTLRNEAGTIGCKVVIARPGGEWQQLLGGSSGGVSARSPRPALPVTLNKRQATHLNESAALEKLTPYYAFDWYGPESNATDFLMALCNNDRANSWILATKMRLSARKA